jgi:hypothetical protein
MLGRVEETDKGWRASWSNGDGEQSAMCRSHQVAIGYIANNSLAALRFHDLRHSYATWLVTSGVPVNVVRKVMGHEQTSTTLDIYTHAPDDYEQHVLKASEGPAVFLLYPEADGTEEEHEGDVGHIL